MTTTPSSATPPTSAPGSTSASDPGPNGSPRRSRAATASRTTGIRPRRVRLKATGEAFSVRPSFLLPYRERSRKVWEAYHAPNRRSFGQRLRRVLQWAREQSLSGWLLEQVQKLCGRSQEYEVAYEHPGGHRTSNMLDRVMRGMSRYFEDGQHLHGSPAASGLHMRAWALLQNFRPWGPEAVRANDRRQSPAERFNAHRYHDDWLQHLQISASLGGYRW